MNWKAFLSILLVFILGCLAGGLGASVYLGHRTTLFFQRGPAAFAELMERRTTRHLSLDAMQKQKIHQYFMQNLQERLRLESQIHPEVQRLNQQTFQQINSVLTPEQVAIFHRDLKEMRQRFNRPALNDAAQNESPPDSSSGVLVTNSASANQPSP